MSYSILGAFLLQKLVLEFQKFHSGDNGNSDSKEINNTLILLAFLYSFKVRLQNVSLHAHVLITYPR